MALSEDSFNARRSKTWVRLSQSWTVRKQLNISRRNSQVAPVRDSPPLKPLIRLSDAAVTVIRRRATLTNHSTQSTMDASCTPGCCTRRISCRSCHGHLVGCPCMVAVVVIVGTRKLMGHYCLSTLSRLTRLRRVLYQLPSSRLTTYAYGHCCRFLQQFHRG